MSPLARATRRPAGARRSAEMAEVTAAITQGSIIPSASIAAVGPAQLQTQWSPRRRPDLAVPRHRSR